MTADRFAGRTYDPDRPRILKRVQADDARFYEALGTLVVRSIESLLNENRDDRLAPSYAPQGDAQIPSGHSAPEVLMASGAMREKTDGASLSSPEHRNILSREASRLLPSVGGSLNGNGTGYLCRACGSTTYGEGVDECGHCARKRGPR